jgi:hypothetical protein
MADAAAGRTHTLRGMRGEFSWLALVVAFVTIAALCVLLTVRLGRIGSPAGPRAAAKDEPR